MATEHFCLRWNNHQSTLVSVFDNLLESGTLVDCTLAADGRYLKAHKVVLSACSPYLGMLLSQHYDKHPIIILKDVKFDELKAMLDYMYRGEVNISQEQLSTFLKAAETLQIKGLTDAGSDEGNGLQPNRPPSSNSTTSANEDPPSPGPPGEGGSSPGPRKRKRNKHGDDGEGDSVSKISLSEGSDRLSATSVGSPSAGGGRSASVKREPADGEGDGQMSVDDSGEVVMMSRPGPSNGGTNNKAPWILSADSSGEEMQLTPGQGGQGQQQQYLQQMMQQMYGGMWMDGGMSGSNSSQTPTDMEQEMLAAYSYGRPNWNMNRYLCTNCGRTYSLQASLYNHKKFECGKLPNFICPYCPHRTKQKGNLKTHIKKRHPEFFSEPFMPSPSRLNSMMNSIMMQSSMMHQNMNMMNSQNPPTSQIQSPMHNSMVQSASSRMPNSTSSYMQNSSKNPSINNLLQAMKSMPQNTPSSGQNANALANANFIQALAQSLPNSTSISPLDIMQVLAQGSQTTPKSPMTPHVGMSPKNTSQSNYNLSQSTMSSSRMSPMNASPASTNPPQSPMAANITPTVNGGIKSEIQKEEIPEDAPSEIHNAPKSPPASNFTSLSLEPADSDDSSDVLVLPSYPVSQ